MIFNRVKELKDKGLTIGITFSSFDLLHAGHIAMLSEAKNHCDYLIAGLAFLLEKKEDWSLLVWLLLQRFYYRQLMYYIAIKSIISSVRGGSVGWNHLERKSTVKITPTK